MKKLNWHEIPWDHCNHEVANLQEELVMALRNGSHKQVKEVQRKLVVGLSARCLAVRKVVTNSGSKTSGIDGILWESSTARTNAIEDLREITMNPKKL
jgi:RNA-directed DNA polymerase